VHAVVERPFDLTPNSLHRGARRNDGNVGIHSIELVEAALHDKTAKAGATECWIYGTHNRKRLLLETLRDSRPAYSTKAYEHEANRPNLPSITYLSIGHD